MTYARSQRTNVRADGRVFAGTDESIPMFDELESILFRKSLGALRDHIERCSGCHRAPLAGELMHELESHRLVCQLCLARLPESKRVTVVSQRVPVGDRHLSVVPRAA